MKIEYIDDTTAVVVTGANDFENLLKATQALLINHEIDACSIRTGTSMPLLSIRKGSQNTDIAILFDKTAATTPQEFFGMKKKEDLGEFPLDDKEEEKLEDFPLDEPAVERPSTEKKEEPVAVPTTTEAPAVEESQEDSNLIITDDMKSLMYALREGRKEALPVIYGAKDVIDTTILNRYTEITGMDLKNELRGGDPGDSSVSLEKNKEYNPDNLLLKRDVKKKHRRFDIQKRDLPGLGAPGPETPYTIIDTAAGKQRFYTYYGADGFQYPLNKQDIEKNAGNIIAAFPTEAERDAYYQKMVTPIDPIVKTDSPEQKRVKQEIMKIQKRFDFLRDANSFRRKLFSHLDRVEELGPNRLEKDPEYMADVSFLLWAQAKMELLSYYVRYRENYSFSNIYDFDGTGKATGINEDNFKAITSAIDFSISPQMYDFSTKRKSIADDVIANFSGLANIMINDPTLNKITATAQDAAMVDYYTEKETKKKEPKTVKEKTIKEELPEGTSLKGKNIVAPMSPEEFFGFQQKNYPKKNLV